MRPPISCRWPDENVVPVMYVSHFSNHIMGRPFMPMAPRSTAPGVCSRAKRSERCANESGLISCTAFGIIP